MLGADQGLTHAAPREEPSKPSEYLGGEQHAEMLWRQQTRENYAEQEGKNLISGAAYEEPLHA